VGPRQRPQHKPQRGHAPAKPCTIPSCPHARHCLQPEQALPAPCPGARRVNQSTFLRGGTAKPLCCPAVPHLAMHAVGVVVLISSNFSYFGLKRSTTSFRTVQASAGKQRAGRVLSGHGGAGHNRAKQHLGGLWQLRQGSHHTLLATGNELPAAQPSASTTASIFSLLYAGHLRACARRGMQPSHR